MTPHWHDYHSDCFRSGCPPHRPVNKKRKNLKKKLKKYLKLNVFGSISQKDFKKDNPYASSLTLHYLTIIRSEINNHHNDKSESIAAMVSFSMVYAEMWAEAYSLVNDLTELSKHSFLVGYNGETRVKLLDPEAITSLSNGEKSKGIPKDYKPTYKYAKTLSKTYHKALFELKGSIKTTETEVIKHHASIVGDTLDAMLELVQGIHPDNEPTEIFLPKTHPQWLDKSTWMESREEG